jgi:hypothetical protein
MRLAAVGLGVAALVTVGSVAAQSAATQGGTSPCAGDSSPAATACPLAPDPSQNDLTPTQWLFGSNIGTKMSQTPTMVTLAASANSGWAAVQARADHALSAATEARSQTRPPAAAPDAAQMQPTPAGQSLTPQRFLIEEWRHTEIGVADSVYHDALMRITAAFDSTQRAPIDDAARTSVLRRLDALLDASNYTWVMFRAQIRRRADSALAALKARD